MTTSWGGTSLPDPTNITLAGRLRGRAVPDHRRRAAYRRTQHRTAVSTRMEPVTAGQFGTIYTKALTNSSATIIFPLYAESPGLTVLPIRGSLSSTPVGGAHRKSTYHAAFVP